MSEQIDPNKIRDELERKIYRHLMNTPDAELQASMVNAVVSYLKAFPPTVSNPQEQAEIKSRMNSMGMTLPFPKLVKG